MTKCAGSQNRRSAARRQGVAGHFVSLALVFLLPGLFEIAHPALHVADDV
jgi:hypothetical protein